MLLNSRLFPYEWFESVATTNNVDDPILSSPDDLGSFARWAFKGEPNAAPYVQLSNTEIKSIAGRLYNNCYGDHNGTQELTRRQWNTSGGGHDTRTTGRNRVRRWAYRCDKAHNWTENPPAPELEYKKVSEMYELPGTAVSSAFRWHLRSWNEKSFKYETLDSQIDLIKRATKSIFSSCRTCQ